MRAEVKIGHQGRVTGGVSVVVPAYRSERTLPELVRRLHEVLADAAERHEIILVEDCGGDATWALIRRMAAADERLRGFRMSRNFGQHNALLLGVRQARYDIVVTLDDDLQNPPEEVPKLLQRLAEGYDVVYGTPQTEQHGLLRDLASRITKISLQKAMGAETARHVSAFRAFRTRLRDAFAEYSNPFVSIDVLLTWATASFTHLPVRHEPRQVGTSNYTLYKLTTHALNMLTGFTTLPLQLASIAGFAFAGFGALILAYVLVRYFVEGGSVAGFPFLASIIAIFSGVQLFALGIIGEYLARMHLRSMGRPPYAVGEATAAVRSADAEVAPARHARAERVET